MKLCLAFTCIIAIVFLFSTTALAQEVSDEELLESQEEISDQSDLVELLESLRANPIDLNKATFQDLEQIPWLTPIEARAIIDYRRTIGRFETKYDLVESGIISEPSFANIANFITVTQPRSFSPSLKIKTRSRMKQRLEKAAGYENGTYPDSPEKVYNRFSVDAFNAIDGFALFEKDSGEKNWDDFSAYYIRFRNLPINTQIVVGNYSIQAAQGLVLWGGSGFSKGSDPIAPVKRRSRGLKPYTSANENSAFNGLAIEAELRGLKWLAFASRHKTDATLTDENEVTSMSATGLHRTPTEIAKKDQLEEAVIGARCEFDFKQRFSLGATAYQSEYKSLILNNDTTRKYFAFQGTQNSVVGADFDAHVQRLNVFGEIARSKNGRHAMNSGAIIDFGDLKFSCLFRDYAIDFQNLHGLGFAQMSGLPQNENGFFTGFKYDFHQTEVSFYYDFYKHPWRRYFEEMPTQGEDFSLHLVHKLVRNCTVRLRWRTKRTDESTSVLNQYHLENNQLTSSLKRTFRVQLDYGNPARFLFRNRLETGWVDFPSGGSDANSGWRDEQGLVLYQDIKIKLSKQLWLQGRYCFFDTDSYQSRIYAYENDLPGMMTNRVFVGKGTYWYILVTCRFMNTIKCYIKYSSLYYDDTQRIGEGNDAISTNTIHDLAIQFETSF